MYLIKLVRANGEFIKHFVSGIIDNNLKVVYDGFESKEIVEPF